MSDFLPRNIRNLIEEFTKLPGIGPKTAERLTFHLLRSDQRKSRDLGDSLIKLRDGIIHCQSCFNFSTENPCEICSNSYREKDLICVVEEPLDIVAIEKTHSFKGVYHVLHGALSPIDGIGLNDLRIEELFNRVRKNDPIIKEIILATNLGLEGEATAQYIYNQLKNSDIQI